ncbi:LysM peptidoglycan-binding domain-containing protein [Photobacterium leiognathi]|uniref:LysM peptidoglycan-binding domain-containing protein n=1 Tax=Photobacterium leiognathi TaxID=553611 RepID=UPI0029811CE2|nr:LysM peptidoglycan-binding domain-containing protein [Photobacterium leiognathi]
MFKKVILTALLCLFKASVAQADNTSHLITEGDSLSQISLDLYDSSTDWKYIHKANPYIKDPNLIFPNDKLYIPQKFSLKSISSQGSIITRPLLSPSFGTKNILKRINEFIILPDNVIPISKKDIGKNLNNNKEIYALSKSFDNFNIYEFTGFHNTKKDIDKVNALFTAGNEKFIIHNKVRKIEDLILIHHSKNILSKKLLINNENLELKKGKLVLVESKLKIGFHTIKISNNRYIDIYVFDNVNISKGIITKIYKTI